MGEMVTFASNGTDAPGYLAVPDRGAGPAVVVIQEWWGLLPHIRDVADRFSAEGFFALAPDLYRGASTTEPDEAAKRLMALDRERACADIAGAAAYLGALDGVTSRSVGAVGFCMGGSLAVWAGQASRAITAMVGFYPAMPWERFSPQAGEYADRHVLLHLDEHEGGTGEPKVVAAMAALRSAGATVEAQDYPGTGHAFFNDTRPEVYNPEAAQAAWSRTIDFLSAHAG